MNKKILNQLRHGTAHIKRLAISNFWMTRADLLERQAVALFRDAGQARENARQAMYLPDDGAEKIYDMLVENGGMKTVVEPEDGKVN